MERKSLENNPDQKKLEYSAKIIFLASNNFFGLSPGVPSLCKFGWIRERHLPIVERIGMSEHKSKSYLLKRNLTRLLIIQSKSG